MYSPSESTKEWRILGQEQDGSLLSSWVAENSNKTCIGIFHAPQKKFEILYEFLGVRNIVQASCNTSKTLLLFVEKEQDAYQPFLVEIRGRDHTEPSSPHPILELPRTKQVFAQFLWGSKKNFEKHYKDKFLVMIHEDSVLQFNVFLKKRPGADHDPHSVASNKIDFATDDWYYDKDVLTHETMARNFIWCQFDATVQSLYYIHYKPTTRISLDLEKDDDDDSAPDVTMRPTLSALQFHDELPRETVVSEVFLF